MWELDHKESWVLKNWCFWTVVLEETLESPLDCREIQPVHPKGNQCWIFIERTDAEAETPIVWPPDVEGWFIWKDPDAGKDWQQEKKGTTQDEMVGWHHQLDGHDFEQVPGVGDGQGALACCSPWGCKESDTTERLNWTELNWGVVLEKTLENPLDCKEIKPINPKGNQSWLFIGGTVLKLKLQYFGHLTQRADSLKKTLMLGKTENRREGDGRGWDGWMALLTQWA